MQDLEGKNRIVKTIDFFKKSGDTRGTLHAKMGTVKERKVKYLTEGDEIKKKWQECIEDLFLYSSSVYSCHFLISSASLRKGK